METAARPYICDLPASDYDRLAVNKRVLLHVKARYTLLVASRNVTLALPEDLLRRLKVVAAKQDTSISALLTATLSQLADQEEGYAEARDAMLADLAWGYDLGTHGKITWSRDSLHER